MRRGEESRTWSRPASLQSSQLSIKMLGTRKPISCSGAARLENKTTDPAQYQHQPRPPSPALSEAENRKQIKEKQHKVIDKIFRTEGDQLFNATVNKEIEKEMKEEEAENMSKSHKIFSTDKGRFQQ